MMHHIVVEDPEGQYFEGSIVDHSVAVQIRGRGGIALPADPTLFREMGNGGYFKRAWGSGWPCDHSIPTHFCPMTLFLTKEHQIVHWAARLVGDGETAGAAPPDSPGTIGFAAVPGRSNTMIAPLTPQTPPARIRDLGACDEQGGWIIKGHAHARIVADGHHSFALYGTGAGLRVAWAAATAVRG